MTKTQMANKNKEYRKRVADRYGDKILEDFDAIFSGDIRLSSLSRKYKISKMRATQIFKLLYGTGFRQVKRDGGVTDPLGRYLHYEPGKTKQFMIVISTELDDEITRQAKDSGKSKAAFIRGCVIDHLNKDDGLKRAARCFGL